MPVSTTTRTNFRQRIGAVALAAALIAVPACSASTSISDLAESAPVTAPAESNDTGSATTGTTETSNAETSSDTPPPSGVAEVRRPLDLAGTSFAWGRINWTVESAEFTNVSSTGSTSDFSINFVATILAENTYGGEMRFANMVFTHADSTTTDVQMFPIAANATERIEIDRRFTIGNFGFDDGEVEAAAEFFANSTITLGDPRLEQMQIGLDGTITGETGITEHAIDTTVFRDGDLTTDGAGDITRFDVGRIQVSADQVVEREYMAGQVGRALVGERYVAVDITSTQILTSFGDNISPSTVKLVVDGVPHSAATGPIESLGEGDVVEGWWLFIVPPATAEMELQFFQDRGQDRGEATATITLDPQIMTTAVSTPVLASQTVSTDSNIGS